MKCFPMCLSFLVLLSIYVTDGTDTISKEWLNNKLQSLSNNGFDPKELKISENYHNYLKEQEQWREKIYSFPVMTVVR